MPQEPGPARAGELGERVPTPLPSSGRRDSLSPLILFSELFPATPSPPDQCHLWPVQTPSHPTPQSCWTGWIPLSPPWAGGDSPSLVTGHAGGRPRRSLMGLRTPDPCGPGPTEALRDRSTRGVWARDPVLLGPCDTGSPGVRGVGQAPVSPRPHPRGACVLQPASLPSQSGQRLAEASEAQPLLSTPLSCPGRREQRQQDQRLSPESPLSSA